MKFLPKLYHTIRSYFTSKVELLYLINKQLVRTDINFRRIYEDKRSLPYGADLKFNMHVDLIYNFKVIHKLALFLFPKLAEVRTE